MLGTIPSPNERSGTGAVGITVPEGVEGMQGCGTEGRG